MKGPVRITDIVEKIRREVESRPPPDRGAAEREDDRLPPIATRSELESLNRNWRFEPAGPLRSHRPRLGPWIVRAKTVFRRLVLAVLESYLDQERRFLKDLVHFNNALADRSDRLLRELTERTKGVAERNDVFLTAFDQRLAALEGRDQERTALACAEGGAPPSEDQTLVAEALADLAPGVAERVAPWLGRFAGSGRVLELGCGRGEVLAALAAAGAVAEGVESSAALVAACRARSLAAEVADLLAHLGATEASALGGLIVSRTAERFAPATWPLLVARAWRALRPGGLLLLEGTGDARSTERLRWLLARQRFAAIEARAADAATEAMLQPLPVDGSTVAGAAEIANRNFERLNRLLFLERDHLLLARRSEEA